MKILISGPAFHSYNESVGRAFKDCGHTVEISNWPNLGGNFFSYTKSFLSRKIKKILRQKLQKSNKERKVRILHYNKTLVHRIKETAPDIFLVLKGDIILPQTLKKIKKGDTIPVMWCYDKATRYPTVIQGGKYYTLFYVFEPSDKKELQPHGIESRFLPLAYDPLVYHKKDVGTTIDICFVGVMYSNRKRILENLIRNHPALRIECWGKVWNWYNPFKYYEYTVKRRTLQKCIHNYNISPEEVNKIYNTTKICLNIHHHQSIEGLNPRTFEILGAGRFELVDYKHVLRNLFELDKEIVTYSNEKELFKSIEYYLDNEEERKKIAHQGHEAVQREHTFKHRAERILKDCEEFV